MNKETLGKKLKWMRKGRPVNGLSKYSIKSIEEGRSSYPVTNLLIYCEALSLQIVMTDMATDENYPIEDIQNIHEILQMLMKRWQITEYSMYRTTGFHYTAPKGKTGSISIATLLAMCSVLHCKLDFLKTN